MDYEKSYKEALERAKKMLASKRSVIIEKQALEAIFPELAESEDEKIRKEIMDYLVSRGFSNEWIAWLKKQGEKANPYSGISFEYNGHTWGMCARDNGVDILFDCELINHLEKPCEQKLTDKVESKFKVGDWLQYRSAEPFLVEEITEQGYINGNSCLPFEWENEIHLWTVQDAKAGDVLACVDKASDCPFIFHNLTEELNPRSYCGVNTVHQFQVNDENGGYWCRSDEAIPATKEQQNYLFQKMKEAGYMWDSYTKKVICIKR